MHTSIVADSGVSDVHPCTHPVPIPDRQHNKPAHHNRQRRSPRSENVREEDAETHPKPIQAMTANIVSVAVTPMVLMSGSMPAVVNAMMSARNDLCPRRRQEKSADTSHTRDIWKPRWELTR